MACKNFINSFVEKVLENNGCCSCNSRRKLCKNFNDEYNHLTDEIMKDYIKWDYEGPYYDPKDRDFILTFLHNLVKKPVSKTELENIIYKLVCFKVSHLSKANSVGDTLCG